MKGIVFVCFLLFWTISHAQKKVNYVPLVKNDKYGLYAGNWELVAKPKYDFIDCSNPDVIVFVKQDEYTFYNNQLEVLHQGNYQAYVKTSGSWVYLVDEGMLMVYDLIDQQLKPMAPYLDSTAVTPISDRFGKYALVSSNGTVLTPFSFKMVEYGEQFKSKGISLLTKGDTAFFYKNNGTLLFKTLCEKAWIMRDQETIAFTYNGKWGIHAIHDSYNIPLTHFKNPNDLTVGESPEYAFVHPYYVIQRHLADSTLEFALLSRENDIVKNWTPSFMTYSCHSNACKLEQYYFIQQIGDSCVIADSKLNVIGSVKADEFVNRNRANWVFVSDGKLVEFELESLQPSVRPYHKLGQSFSTTNQDSYYGLIDKDLNVVVPFVYSLIRSLGRNVEIQLFEFTKGHIIKGKRGLFSENGKVILEAKYKQIRRLNGEYSNVLVLYNQEKIGRLAYLSEDGQELKMLTDYILIYRNTDEYRENGVYFPKTAGGAVYVSSDGTIEEE